MTLMTLMTLETKQTAEYEKIDVDYNQLFVRGLRFGLGGENGP